MGNLDDRRRSGRPKKVPAADKSHIMLTSQSEDIQQYHQLSGLHYDYILAL